MPSLSTDGQPLRVHSLAGVLCRQDAPGAACRPVDGAETAQPLPTPGPGATSPILWTDPLPPALRSGNPRPVAYRVELKAPSGKSAGYSDPVYAAAGAAPPPVTEFRAEGTRSGIELRWLPAAGAGEVVLRRVEPAKAISVAGNSGVSAPAPAGKAHARGVHKGRALPGGHSSAGPGAGSGANSGVVWLQAAPDNQNAAATIDNSAEAGTLYRYTAMRREQVQAGGRILRLESSPSAEVEITWQDVYPPAAPTSLMAIGFEATDAGSQKAAGYAVDLVWEPVEDDQLAGYLVFRQEEPATYTASVPAAAVQLTPQPLPTAAFHDATALPTRRYRYSVIAVGTNGQRSGAATADLLPHTAP